MRIAVVVAIILAVGAGGLVASYLMVPIQVAKELHLGIVGAYDATAGAQLTGGSYWLNGKAVPAAVSVPLKTNPTASHIYATEGLPVIDGIDVPYGAGIDELLALLVPGSKPVGPIIEPWPEPWTKRSTGSHPIAPTVDMWNCLLETQDGRLDSCCILVFANVTDQERTGFVLRGRRSGGQWLGTVTLEDFRAAILGKSAGMRRKAEGHVLSLSVPRMRPVSELPAELRGKSWVELE